MELRRYPGVLLPFAAAALIWPRWALAISQAPILMFVAVHLAETKLIRLSPGRGRYRCMRGWRR